MSTKGTYLAVFFSNKTGPRWREWYAMSEDERRAKDAVGLAALKAWDVEHQDSIVYMGGPLGKTKRTTLEGVADVMNELTVFCVVRAPSHEVAAKLFEDHPHITIFPCDAVDVMPLLGPGAES
jgi:fibrillarin-like rRNA methylase